ncbi:aminotransferase class III-fold pyridoxal phosphate-dependent enzyme [Nonomuraea mesophila]|uniref:glutamate-1-semialdehyde 2,1-aminomutase n=2 Tax=Nonomuraea mesophila TaxID=2530382 RepID=A0A4R5FVJ1_9ACTN|nr:aminotransferase class III-fold pyridoxal phosphate-dependent enzyme [Nonomuraea mesophila]
MVPMSRTLHVSRDLHAEGRRHLAGGVSSDARRVAGVPLYVDRAQGARLWDVDGNSYIDYVLGQGPALLGHCPPEVVEAIAAQAARGMVYSAQHAAEVRVAERVCAMVPSAERVRFNTVGSEAVHGALRLARGYTGRSKILKFEGHYHGWLDPVLYSVHPAVEAAGPSREPVAVPGTAGQQPGHADDLIICPWNDLETLTGLMERHSGQIAAVIAEPVLCNTGAISPDPGYLEGVRRLCDEHGSLLIFDEIITGFRLAPGGAQEHLGITPDLSVFGKAMAGGMQVSALTGRAAVMDHISTGKVAHAGTFNSQPVGMAAAETTLRILDERREEVYGTLYERGAALMEGLRSAADKAGVPMLVDGPGPVFQTYFTDAPAVRDYRDFAATDRARMARLHEALLDRGVNMVPRGLWFMSTAHTAADVDATVDAFAGALRDL